MLMSLAICSVLLMSVQLSSPSAASAVGWKFCPSGNGYGWLDPYPTGTYRCDAPDSASGYGLDLVTISTLERAGCVDYADVWHNLINSWVCYPKGTEWGGISVRQDGGWYRGVIRNNNLSYKGLFTGGDFFN
jgi:hypothetical protein